MSGPDTGGLVISGTASALAPDPARPPGTDARAILALAVPAFGSLVAEPLLLLADSAIVGRLGTVPLAGLGVAGALLATGVNLFVFLAYGSTAAVARRLGAGDRRGAVAQGVDGLWLAAVLGVGTLVAGELLADDLVGLFGAGPAVSAQAASYLRWSLPGVPAMLLMLASTGVLRGLQDTRTPLVVAVGGSGLNAVLNLLLVHGAGPWPGMGIAGSGLGTALAQLGMAAALGLVVLRGARRLGAPLRPDRAGIAAAGRTGVPLLVRTVALRGALLATTYAAASQGAAALAAHQVAGTVWTLLAFALDALAIAAQAVTGAALGAGQVDAARAATARMVRWGVGAGAVLGLGLLAGRDLLPPLFSTDRAVGAALVAALLVAALAQPLAGYVFVLDGVLIGAGDGRYLAVVGLLQLAGYVPLALAVVLVAPGGAAGLAWLWVAFAGGFMASRALALGLRERSGRWLVTGAVR